MKNLGILFIFLLVFLLSACSDKNNEIEKLKNSQPSSLSLQKEQKEVEKNPVASSSELIDKDEKESISPPPPPPPPPPILNN